MRRSPSPAHITGTVTDASGAPLPEHTRCVRLGRGSRLDDLANGDTDANGAYDIGGLPAGTYRVCFYGLEHRRLPERVLRRRR